MISPLLASIFSILMQLSKPAHNVSNVRTAMSPSCVHSWHDPSAYYHRSMIVVSQRDCCFATEVCRFCFVFGGGSLSVRAEDAVDS